MECTLSVFAGDTMLVGNVDLFESNGNVDLCSRIRIVMSSHTTFNKLQCKVLHLDLNNAMQKYRFEKEWLESCPVEKDLWMLVNIQLNVRQ